VFEVKLVPFVPCPQDIRHEMPNSGTLRPTLPTAPKTINIYRKNKQFPPFHRDQTAASLVTESHTRLQYNIFHFRTIYLSKQVTN